MYRALRRFLESEGYREVETPALVPAPGMEPHIDAFEVRFTAPASGESSRLRYLITSPEYAMKRLLAEGFGPIFQICKAFRNGEISATHNPEFTLLELYRPGADYVRTMSDLERALAAVAERFPAHELLARVPYERLEVEELFRRSAGIELRACPDGEALRRAARRAGFHAEDSDSFEDVFFRVFLERIEPGLGEERPVFLVDYPAPLAALARLKPGDPVLAERFELYAGGLELANGFSELTDAGEQRLRLVREQGQRIASGKPGYPIDEDFLAALALMPPAGGVAVGLDRVLMLLVGARAIGEVLLFPARDFPAPSQY